MNKPFIRNQEGAALFYDVLASSKRYYYLVEMLGADAVSCECSHFVLGHKTCKHMTTAEEAEKQFQKTQQGGPPPAPFLHAPLNGNQGFSLLKK